MPGRSGLQYDIRYLDIRYLHVYTLLESIDELVCADKIEFINVAFLLKDASIEVVYVKLPEVRAFELMNF